MSATTKKGMSRTTWMVIAGVVVVIAIALFGGYQYASTPRFCDSCHIMNTRYVSWHRTMHWDNTDCLSCHADPGFVGAVVAHIGGARYLWSIITDTRTSDVLKAAINDESCLRCHSDMDAMDMTTRGHSPAHAAHKDAEVGCITCHDNLAHGTLMGDPVHTPMQTCTGCHGMFDTAGQSCKTCHPAPGFSKQGGSVPVKDFNANVTPEFNQAFKP